MTTVVKLARIFELLKDAGAGDEIIGGADHDVIFLVMTDKVPEDSTTGKELRELGASIEFNGWVIYV